MNKTTTKFQTVRACLVALACVSGYSCLHAGVSCDVDSAALTFSLYDPSSTSPTDGVGTVDLHCSNPLAATPNGVSVALSISPTSDRKMRGNGHTLNYGIYSNAARSANWGDGSAAPMLSTGALQANESKSLHFTLYGRIPPLQNIAAGNYSDSLLITLSP